MQLSSSEVLGMHFIVKFNCLPIQKSKTAEMRTDQNLVCFMFKVMRVFYDDTSHFKHNFIAMHQRFQMSGFTLHLQRKVFFFNLYHGKTICSNWIRSAFKFQLCIKKTDQKHYSPTDRKCTY